MTETAAMLADVETLVGRFIVFRDQHQSATVAMYVMHTHALEACESTPYLAVLSAEKRSGKSRLLELFARICARSEHVSGISEAALFQLVQEVRPTLLVDEVDAVFGVAAERSEALRGAINSGNRRSGSIVRGGKDGQVVRYSTFSAKVLAGIETGKLPDTIRDRSIPILMRRKPPSQTVERLFWRDVGHEVDEVHDRVAVWAKGHEEQLGKLRPDLPGELDDRAAESWEPLLAIADLAGGSWPARAREAARVLAGDFGVEEDSRGVRLLADLRAIFTADLMPTADLLTALNGLDESAWSTYHDGSGVNARDLGRWLRVYEVTSKTVRIGSATAKGYAREDLGDAWHRYLQPDRCGEASQASQASQSGQDNTLEPGNVTAVTDVTDFSGIPNPDDEAARLEAKRASDDGPVF